MNIEIVRLLVEFKVDTNARNNHRLMPLHITEKNRDVEAINCSWPKWAPQGHKAAYDQVYSTILLADVNFKDNNRWALLYLTVLKGNIEFAKQLMSEFNVDSGTKNICRQILLYLTIQKEDVEVIKMLMAEFRTDASSSY
ncbi:hypothetical protein BC938DRAFT_473667 [Jimgerdemannia flammicorona]|uniref:Uncharacterized protein n=1 Tax=Jimgerdemannia flammicorona TaxID=994334 RepID=A0A433Q3Z2_9FUNG|nr:hypothetical protein BC938DRAFT_473667 [Jimgerdemannia flammicorona]